MEVPPKGFAFNLSLHFLLIWASQLNRILTLPLGEFYSMAVQAMCNAYKSSIPTHRIERNRNCFSRFESFVSQYSTYVQYVARKQKSKYKRIEKKYKSDLLDGIHQKMSTAVPKSKIIEQDYRPQRMMML